MDAPEDPDSRAAHNGLPAVRRAGPFALRLACCQSGSDSGASRRVLLKMIFLEL